MTTNTWPKEERTGSTLHEGVTGLQRVILMFSDFFERRSLALDPDGFPERRLSERLRVLLDGVFLSPSSQENQYLSLSRVRCQGKSMVVQAKSVFFERMCQVAITPLLNRVLGKVRAAFVELDGSASFEPKSPCCVPFLISRARECRRPCLRAESFACHPCPFPCPGYLGHPFRKQTY